MNAYTLTEQVQDTIKEHGIQWAAKHYSHRICFTHFYFMAFGRLPSTVALRATSTSPARVIHAF